MRGMVSLVFRGHLRSGLWLQVCEVMTWDQGGEQGGFTSLLPALMLQTPGPPSPQAGVNVCARMCTHMYTIVFSQRYAC